MDSGFSKELRFESSSTELKQISDEANRIAATLARLAVRPDTQDAQHTAGSTSDRSVPSVKIETVRHAIETRRLRSKYFEGKLFAEPAWDMLLDLFQSELAQRPVSVSSLCIASAVPATTALRWINTMMEAGLFNRRSDPHDSRRIFVELTPHASEAMRQYFGEEARLMLRSKERARRHLQTPRP